LLLRRLSVVLKLVGCFFLPSNSGSRLVPALFPVKGKGVVGVLHAESVVYSFINESDKAKIRNEGKRCVGVYEYSSGSESDEVQFAT